jgi:hypothetical protein
MAAFAFAIPASIRLFIRKRISELLPESTVYFDKISKSSCRDD